MGPKNHQNHEPKVSKTSVIKYFTMFPQTCASWPGSYAVSITIALFRSLSRPSLRGYCKKLVFTFVPDWREQANIMIAYIYSHGSRWATNILIKILRSSPFKGRSTCYGYFTK